MESNVNDATQRPTLQDFKVLLYAPAINARVSAEGADIKSAPAVVNALKGTCSEKALCAIVQHAFDTFGGIATEHLFESYKAAGVDVTGGVMNLTKHELLQLSSKLPLFQKNMVTFFANGLKLDTLFARYADETGVKLSFQGSFDGKISSYGVFEELETGLKTLTTRFKRSFSSIEEMAEYFEGALS